MPFDFSNHSVTTRHHFSWYPAQPWVPPTAPPLSLFALFSSAFRSPLVAAACHKLPKLMLLLFLLLLLLLHPLIHWFTHSLSCRLLAIFPLCCSLVLAFVFSFYLSVCAGFPVACACPRFQRERNVRLSCRHFLFQFLRFSWWFPWHTLTHTRTHTLAHSHTLCAAGARAADIKINKSDSKWQFCIRFL